MVCQRDELYWKIRKMWDSLPGILNDRDIEITHKLLSELTNVSKEEKQVHIDNINEKFNREQKNEKLSEEVSVNTNLNQEPVELITEPNQSEINIRLETQPETSMICPKCGGLLVLRTARKGSNAGNQFYGCGNFPKCRYIQGI